MNLHLLLNRCLCDYRCIFCTMGSEHHLADQAQILTDFDYGAEWQRIEQVIESGAGDPAIDALHIMGNDPCNHPDIERIIERARERGFRKIVFETNGLRLDDPAFVKRVIDAGARWFKIPIYGSRTEIHDEIVRLPGAFARVSRALDNLAQHPVEVHLHSLILKQNASDLPNCRFPYQLYFRFPFRHDKADFPYDFYAPRLSDVPREVLARSDLLIPCINGKRAKVESREARVRPEAPDERDEDTHVKRYRPSKCSAQTCPDFAFCRGIYPAYLDTYGEDEFEYRPHVGARARRGLFGLAPSLGDLRERAARGLERRLGKRGSGLVRRFATAAGSRRRRRGRGNR